MLLFINWNPSPVIVDLGFYELRWYSFLFALGFVLAYQILKVEYKKAALDQQLLDTLTVYLVIATIVGARLAHCLFYDCISPQSLPERDYDYRRVPVLQPGDSAVNKTLSFQTQCTRFSASV